MINVDHEVLQGTISQTKLADDVALIPKDSSKTILNAI